MLGHNLVLVVDSLSSLAPHSYEQLWHLFPDANLTLSGDTAHVATAEDQPIMQVVQGAGSEPLSTQAYYGDTSPMQGWYSATYGQVQKNHVVGYTQRGDDAVYYTLIAIGPDADAPASVAGSRQGASIHLLVCSADTSAAVTITNQAAAGETLAVGVNRSCKHD